MATKKFSNSIFLGEIFFTEKLSLSITKGKLSSYDIKVNYKDLDDSDFRKTPKHIHWIFDIMIKKEHKPEEIKEFVNFLQVKWNDLSSSQCSSELRSLHNWSKTIEDLFEDIKEDISSFNEFDNFWYFPKDFLALFWYLMILQEKNNRSDAYMFKNMLEWIMKDEYNPYKIISIATGKYWN